MSTERKKPAQDWTVIKNDRRHAKNRTLTLTDDTWGALGELAGAGGSRSAVVERLVEEERARGKR